MLTRTRSTAIILTVRLIIGLNAGLLPATAQDDPVAQLYAPSGPYAVGRTTYVFTDEAREEVHTLDDEADRREFVVDVWYPADVPDDAEPALYFPEPFADLFTDMFKLTPGRLQAVRANAVEDAPVAAAMNNYPVLILDPGFSAHPRQYTILIEELASQGYVVFGMTHPYATLRTVFPDGRVIDGLSADRLSTVWAPQDMYMGEFEGAWFPDTSFVIEQIAVLNAGDPKDIFTGKLETDRFGVLGHSQGARTVSEICYRDARCVGAINMDGAYSAEVQLDYDRPYMVLLADHGVDEFINEFDTGLESLGEGYFVLMIPQTDHNSFVDAPFWVPLVIDGDWPTGTVAAQVALLDYRLYATAFFDRYMREMEVPLLDGPSAEHPEVFFLNRLELPESPTVDVAPRVAGAHESNVGDVQVGAADVWLYEAEAGEVVDIMVLADRPADRADRDQRVQFNLFDTLLAVRAPDGSLLAANDDMGGGFTNSALMKLTLPETGTYTIEVRSWANRTGGTYTLVIIPKAND